MAANQRLAGVKRQRRENGSESAKAASGKLRKESAGEAYQ
jgi:hypothetical protein